MKTHEKKHTILKHLTFFHTFYKKKKQQQYYNNN